MKPAIENRSRGPCQRRPSGTEPSVLARQFSVKHTSSVHLYVTMHKCAAGDCCFRVECLRRCVAANAAFMGQADYNLRLPSGSLAVKQLPQSVSKPAVSIVCNQSLR